MRRLLYLVTFVAAAAALSVVWREYGTHTKLIAWQRHASPGTLTVAHATLESNCAACHSPVKGAADEKCIGCHANETALLQRQPTAFHADIQGCAQCHIEHQGAQANLRKMDHIVLARIGLERMSETSKVDGASFALRRWVKAHPGGSSPTSSHPELAPLEMTLYCVSCHATKDQHVGLFGPDCAACHATTQWTLAQFQHPSSDSVDCAQCHQAPPSHYMMHFSMVSKRVARQEDARVAQCCGRAQVNQCYRCHQTTSWNDIKGVGWYKHH
ncbi:MAG TPA: cytochrome C [Steroidobacteraceae bacterium]|nr:cytochrome C [Steroidobacteraceae bacterium]